MAYFRRIFEFWDMVAELRTYDFSPYYSTHNTTSMKKSTQNATFKQKATVRDSHIEAQLTAEQKSALHILESGEV